MKNIRCSIAIVTYNSSRFFREQLDSVLRCTGPDDEIVISDDGSSDDTLDIFATYSKKDSRIHVFQNDGPHGFNGNASNAYSHCSGRFIFHCDDDNIWMPGKIEKVLAAFEANKEALMVMHDAKIVDESLNEIVPSFFGWRNSKPGILHNTIKLGYGGSMIAFRRELLPHILPIPQDMPFFADSWIGFMADKYGKSVFIPEVLSLWRRHEGNLSGSPKTSSGKEEKPKKRAKKESRLLSRLKILWYVLRH